MNKFRINQMVSALVIIAGVSSLPAHARQTQPCAGASLSCQTKQQIQDIMVDLNQTGSDVIDTFVQDPDKAITENCLNDLFSIDFNASLPNFSDLIAEAYAQLKASIVNMTCSAIEDKYNEYMEKIDVQLEAPMGLGSIDIGPGRRMRDFGDVWDPDVELDNDALREELLGELGGELTPITRSVTQNILNDVTNSTTRERRERRAAEELKTEGTLGLEGFWKKGDDNDNNN